MGQHIFQKDPVPHRRFIDEYVRNRTDEFAVLQDRAPGHSLHDPAGYG